LTQYEKEADYYGLYFAARAGYKPSLERTLAVLVPEHADQRSHRLISAQIAQRAILAAGGRRVWPDTTYRLVSPRS
jgi:hypothetical protein